MEQLKPMTDFFSGIATDPRIGSTHIALFSAIMNLYIQSGYQNPLVVYRCILMPSAKIFGLGTFHKTIRELNEYGYLKYESSFNRKGSKIFLLQQ